jgi:hypothetical protein
MTPTCLPLPARLCGDHQPLQPALRFLRRDRKACREHGTGLFPACAGADRPADRSDLPACPGRTAPASALRNDHGPVRGSRREVNLTTNATLLPGRSERLLQDSALRQVNFSMQSLRRSNGLDTRHSGSDPGVQPPGGLPAARTLHQLPALDPGQPAFSRAQRFQCGGPKQHRISP